MLVIFLINTSRSSFKFLIVIFVYFALLANVEAKDCNQYSLKDLPNLVNIVDSLTTESFQARAGDIEIIKKNSFLMECLSKQFNYQKGIAQAYQDRGLYMYYVSEFKEAIELLNASIEITNKEKYLTIEVNNYNFLGLIYSDLGQYEIAMTYQVNYYNIGEILNNQVYIGEASGNIAGIFIKLKKFEKALEYEEKARDIFLKIEAPTQRVFGWMSNHFGVIYNGLGETEKAIESFNNGIKIWKEEKMPRGLGYTYTALGNLYNGINDFKQSEYYFRKALEIGKQYKTSHQIETRFALAKLLFSLGRNEPAIKNNKAVIAFCKEQKLFQIGVEATQLMIDYYTENGQADLVILYEKDKLLFQKEEFNRKLIVLDIRYDYEKKAFEKKLLLKEELALNKAQVYKQKLALLGALFIFSLLSFFGFKQYKKIKEEQFIIDKLKKEYQQVESGLLEMNEQIQVLSKLNKQVQKDNESLEFNLAEKILKIAHEHEILKKISVQIKSLKIDPKEKQKLIRIIRLHKRENIWDSIDLQFAKIHEKLYKKLIKFEAKLTSNDLRLCAFLKMQLSSKEIAQILHRTPESIRVSRSRLRKKLNLQQSENIQSFLFRIELDTFTNVSKTNT